MAVPTLLKDLTTTLVTPYQWALPAVDPIAFRMFATPPPLGFTYRQDYSNGELVPNSMATFNGWPQVVEAPRERGRQVLRYEFQSVEGYLNANGGSGSVAVPLTWNEVYNTEGIHIGWMVPIYGLAYLPLRYYGPIANMQYVQFPDHNTAPNGYPFAEGVISGYFNAPTVNGFTKVWGRYKKDSRGVWLRQSWEGLPSGYVMSGFAHVVAMQNFPGRPAVPASPPVYTNDYHVGWNAGANSIGWLDGDVTTSFSARMLAAGAVGFAPAGTRAVGRYQSLTHCFYFDTDERGGPRARAMESGRLVGGYWGYTEETVFKLSRENGIVEYFIDTELIYISNTPSGGPLMVGASLYRAGDGVF